MTRRKARHIRTRTAGNERYLSARQAAMIAGWLTERQVMALCHTHRLYATRKGTRWQIPRERFLACLGIA